MLLPAPLHLERGSPSQVSLKIRFKNDSSHDRWAASVVSDYWEIECFIWGHGAVAQKAGIKGEKLAGRPNRRKQDTCHFTEVTSDQF